MARDPRLKMLEDDLPKSVGSYIGANIKARKAKMSGAGAANYKENDHNEGEPSAVEASETPGPDTDSDPFLQPKKYIPIIPSERAHAKKTDVAPEEAAPRAQKKGKGR